MQNTCTIMQLRSNFQTKVLPHCCLFLWWLNHWIFISIASLSWRSEYSLECILYQMPCMTKWCAVSLYLYLLCRFRLKDFCSEGWSWKLYCLVTIFEKVTNKSVSTQRVSIEYLIFCKLSAQYSPLLWLQLCAPLLFCYDRHFQLL